MQIIKTKKDYGFLGGKNSINFLINSILLFQIVFQRR